MEAYRVAQQQLIFEATGTRDVLELPLETFENRDSISVDKVIGSVRLMNDMFITEKESEANIEEVLQLELP